MRTPNTTRNQETVIGETVAADSGIEEMRREDSMKTADTKIAGGTEAERTGMIGEMTT